MRSVCVEVDAGQSGLDGVAQAPQVVAGHGGRKLLKELVGIARPHRGEGRAGDVVFPRLVGDLPDDGRPRHFQPRADGVHSAGFAGFHHVVHGLIEEPRAIFEGQHFLPGRETALEGEASQQAFAHAMHRADERLRGPFRERGLAGGDEAFPHPVLEFTGRLHGEGGADDALRLRNAGHQGAFEFLNEPPRLAAAGAGADERDVGEILHRLARLRGRGQAPAASATAARPAFADCQRRWSSASSTS